MARFTWVTRMAMPAIAALGLIAAAACGGSSPKPARTSEATMTPGPDATSSPTSAASNATESPPAVTATASATREPIPDQKEWNREIVVVVVSRLEANGAPIHETRSTLTLTSAIRWRSLPSGGAAIDVDITRVRSQLVERQGSGQPREGAYDSDLDKGKPGLQVLDILLELDYSFETNALGQVMSVTGPAVDPDVRRRQFKFANPAAEPSPQLLTRAVDEAKSEIGMLQQLIVSLIPPSGAAPFGPKWTVSGGIDVEDQDNMTLQATYQGDVRGSANVVGNGTVERLIGGRDIGGIPIPRVLGRGESAIVLMIRPDTFWVQQFGLLQRLRANATVDINNVPTDVQITVEFNYSELGLF